MTETIKVTKEDIHLKARLISEGVRVNWPDGPVQKAPQKIQEVDLPKKIDGSDTKKVMELYAKALQGGDSVIGLGATFKLDGSGLIAPIYPNQHSRLEFTAKDNEVTLTDGGEVVATGRTSNRPEWINEKLSNGMPVTVALPGMSKSIINVVFNLSCINYNTGRGCRYCNLFANPVSKRIVMTSKETLREYAKLQAEAIKIATDNGWHGNLAISGGAFAPAQRGEYLERLDIVLTEVRNAVGDEKFNKLRKTYNHYPPENFDDMHDWKEIGIDATSIDLEVLDDAYFAAICPGKNAYKPLPYWKEAQEASVDIFGPIFGTTGCVVVGIEPMSTLTKGIDERLSKGVMPLPLVFFSAPGSAYWGFRAPTAEWIVEASDKMVDSYMKHMPKYLPALAKMRGGKGGGRPPRRETTHLSVVFDELERRVQELMGGLIKQPKQEV